MQGELKPLMSSSAVQLYKYRVGVLYPFQIKPCHARNVQDPTNKHGHLPMTSPGEQEQFNPRVQDEKSQK